MTLHRILIHLSYYLYCFSTYSNCYTLVYHTENTPSVQFYDCIYYKRLNIQDNIQNVKYCRQQNESRPLERHFNQSCHHGGQLWSFEALSLCNISASDVLQWSSSIEQTDHYAKYLYNHSLVLKDKYICNCTNPSSFGKFCEYEYYNGSTSFDDAIKNQFEPVKDTKISIGSQLHSNRPCYTTWICDSGLLCLDWRHICDGKQQCVNGLDEDYCEVLEFNECEDDEYRCANGMCIPEEYWLDGDYDCMDRTDEINTLVASGQLCADRPSFICDEHLCPSNQWSCGDGQCINDAADRHKGTRLNSAEFCKNARDIQYMCEAVRRSSIQFWTMDGGYCLPYPLNYQRLGLDTTSLKKKCALSIKCALSNIPNRDCECKNINECRRAVNNSCTSSYQQYPALGPIISPYIYMFYARDRDWTNTKPDILRYYGEVKCVGYQFIINDIQLKKPSETFQYYSQQSTEAYICNMTERVEGFRNYSGPHYDISCWKNSKTSNNRTYQVSTLCKTRCISKYRVRDGIRDCYPSEESSKINNSCPQIQRHRLQCSSSELTCLVAGGVGNSGTACSNKRDEFDDKDNVIKLETLACQKRTDPGCTYLQNYIRISSYETTIFNNSILDDHSITTISFRSYCDSFFDTKSGYDESPEFCLNWICPMDKYQCLSGQCIPHSWVCDGEWDCNDGSDEQRIFIMNDFKEHNRKLINLTEIKNRCFEKYQSDKIPFGAICNITTEYPCFRTDVDDPFNLTLNRPCINLTQIGDGTTDCLSALDERNRLQCSDHKMLGFHLQYNSSLCINYYNLCTNLYSSVFGTNFAYKAACFYRQKYFKNDTISDCNSEKDVMCLNNTCIKNARCNNILECPHGEDEYRCVKYGTSDYQYRYRKSTKRSIQLALENYPSSNQSLSNKLPFPLNDTDIDVENNNSVSNVIMMPESNDYITTVYEKRHSKYKSVYEIVRNSSLYGLVTFQKDYLPFICNRGIAIKYYTGHTVCFCPPSYYGAQCEFYSDRITIVTHLDLTNYRSTPHQIAVIKILTTFLFQSQIIDYYEFHVNPWLENENSYIKQTIYFLYLRTKEFLQMKKNNRSGTQLYSVRFEAFKLHMNEMSETIGVWQYPIYFDFLPSFRLSKILRFHSPETSSISNRPCLNHLCKNNGICQEFVNSNHSSYFCSCRTGYYGIHCQSYDENCNNYCAPNSICKPKHRGILTENIDLFCLCSISRFGSGCYIKNNKCQENPCLHGGTCVVQYDPDNMQMYICVCTDLFQGNHCQHPKGNVVLTFILSTNSIIQTNDVVATTISFNDYHNRSLHFNTRHQRVYHALPSHLTLIYNQKHTIYAPSIAIMKVYESNYRIEQPKYYILYYQVEQKEIDITVDLTTENHCPEVQTLWHLISNIELIGYSNHFMFNSTTAVFLYNHICRAKQNMNIKFRCFRDFNYLCICESNHYHAECFGYNPSIDECSLCLSDGHCLGGELNIKNDFLCLCSRCYHGKMCEYSTELMSFTLDSLIVKDIQNNHQISAGVYISIPLIIFLFGLFNNFSSFLTFIRRKPRKFGVGNYLFIISIIDQCSLLLLFLKIIHIILGTDGTLFSYDSLNRYSCKIISYLLSAFTRLTYWLTSFVTIERLCMVLFPRSTVLKNPRLAFALSIFAVLMVCSMHIHEILYYTTINDPSYTSVNITLCVTNYTQSHVSTYNRVNTLLHYFIPFLIQMISITILIIQTTFSRARTSGSRRETFGDLFRKQLKTQKELYITPMIIVLSSLPQIILSFSYACTELKQSWQRYSLLTAYFLSYLPQILGFILYVLPSTAFSDEFRQTIIGKRLLRQQRRSVETKAR